MSFCKEDLIVLTVVGLLNKAIENGNLKIPKTKSQFDQGSNTKVANLRIREPSVESKVDSENESPSLEDTPDNELEQQVERIGKKVIKKVKTMSSRMISTPRLTKQKF